jgi:hypothetical protein
MRFRSANIRVINRRNSRLDRDSRCLPKEKHKVVDWSFHISTYVSDFATYQAGDVFRRKTRRSCHSYLSATMGSTRIARRAGM